MHDPEIPAAWVYILSSRRNGTLYTGSTRWLVKRIWEHRNKVVPSFTAKYDVTRLVWFEPHASISKAALRERRIKRWRRAWKLELIETENPQWLDLWDRVAQGAVG